MKTGLNANTFERLIYDSGLVYADYGLGTERVLGATRGGNKAEIMPEIRKMPFDGSPGDVQGDKRRVGGSYKLTVNLVENVTENILMAIPGADSSAGATHDAITLDRQLVNGDYLTNVTLVLEKSGTSELYTVQFSNCLVLSGYTIDGKEKDEAVNTVEFTAHYAVSDLDTAPFAIENPFETGSGFWTLTYNAGTNGTLLSVGDGGDVVTQIVADTTDGQPVYAVADSGYTFNQWSDANTDNPRTDTSVGADITVTAEYV